MSYGYIIWGDESVLFCYFRAWLFVIFIDGTVHNKEIAEIIDLSHIVPLMNFICASIHSFINRT